ncbi:MAG: anti-sigma factor family protein [bacterium]
MEHTEFEKNLKAFIQSRLPSDQEEHFEEHYLSCRRCFAAVHKRIEDEEIIDRYVLGKLTPAVETFLEKHCLACETCFQELKATEKIILGLKEAAKLEEIKFDEPKASLLDKIRAWLKNVAHSPAFALAAAVLIMILIYPAYLGIVKLPEFQNRLQQPYLPQANPITYSLSQSGVRGATPVITLPRQDPKRLFLLTFTLLEKTVVQPNYKAHISDDAGNVIWREEDLSPAGDFEVFTLMCQQAFFRSGAYELRVFELDPADLHTTKTFVFPFEIAFEKR